MDTSSESVSLKTQSASVGYHVRGDSSFLAVPGRQCNSDRQDGRPTTPLNVPPRIISDLVSIRSSNTYKQRWVTIRGAVQTLRGDTYLGAGFLGAAQSDKCVELDLPALILWRKGFIPFREGFDVVSTI